MRSKREIKMRLGNGKPDRRKTEKIRLRLNTEDQLRKEIMSKRLDWEKNEGMLRLREERLST